MSAKTKASILSFQIPVLSSGRFCVDIVKAWSRIKQNNTAIESVILKVKFPSSSIFIIL